MKRLALGVALAALLSVVAGSAVVGTSHAVTPPKPLPRVSIYVESQGLCFDSVVTAQDLPARGPFQVLAPDPQERCGEGGLVTEFGPGDQGYVGGRWMLTMPDGTVVRFSCPLLGPGTAAG